jgi:RNA polymerase sigma-54 factor
MAYELKQELRLSQKLMLTPQLQLAIKLLQLSRQELIDAVSEELEQNPVLEDASEVDGVEDKPTPEAEMEKSDMDWQEYLAQGEGQKGSTLDFSQREDDGFFESRGAPDKNLREYLSEQLGMVAGISEEERKIAEFIIGNVDEHGYLRMVEAEPDATEAEQRACVIREVASLISVDELKAQSALDVVHGFDPPGIGARTTRECLCLQAAILPEQNPLVEPIIMKHLDQLATKNYKVMAKALGASVDKIIEAAGIITDKLNPMPGSGFGTEEARVVIPDAHVERVGGEYVVFLNDSGLPRLKVSAYYRKMLGSNGAQSSEVKGYVQEKFKSAIWLIKSVHQRQRTLKRVVESIVKFQKEFLDKGLQYLKPMVLREVAEDIEMHESTISRVTTNKYVQTPRGIFELKYFFSTALSDTGGGDITSEYIKQKILVILDGEDAKSPFSDQQMVVMLKEDGMVLARRTVAKYREELGFAASSKRKRFY